MTVKPDLLGYKMQVLINIFKGTVMGWLSSSGGENRKVIQIFSGNLMKYSHLEE
jgi:hypothetical protein